MLTHAGSLDSMRDVLKDRSIVKKEAHFLRRAKENVVVRTQTFAHVISLIVTKGRPSIY